MIDLEDKVLKHWDKCFSDFKNRNNISNKCLFILLTGLPGSGKSTLAKKISILTGIPHLDFSIFCKEVLGYHTKKTIEYQNIGEIIDSLVFNHFLEGGSLIYDTTSINNDMRNHHFKNVPDEIIKILLWVRTDKEVCRNRLALRPENERPDINYNSFRNSIHSTKTFDDFCREFEKPYSYISGDNSRTVMR